MARHDLEISNISSKEDQVDAFEKRMNIAIKRAGGATIMSEKAGVSTSVLRKWRAGLSEPTLSSLVRMARAAGLSVEWLATGEGTPDAGPSAGQRLIDLETLEDVIIRTRRISEYKSLALKPEAEARIIRLVYEFSMRQGQPMDEVSLNNIIELASL
ncbi:helix-turn-helix domain-containing protein [Halomonas sp. MCCC 1A11036]|uniref:Helix-turn-helix domain-containing protein n=1 Tax=Billgrantia zhangzhouensis TaxID=2733481 RepID=A0ABS9ADM6_9GAMM|nr:helix-turn-helix domain-containing protein [Halomonas zhangzhouensis]MCE8019828.1 helix-turn-helix domain-containing protein [Halomonas zhangzhouensis]